jgi:ATP-dependent protease ClpP protease subunit
LKIGGDFFRKSLLFCACFVLVCPHAAAEPKRQPGNNMDAARVAEFKHFFNGPITIEKVDKFIAERPPGTTKKLIISSDGGSAIAGMKLARWVKDNDLEVEVYLYCHSACANLVFLAGNKKIIGTGSLVTWHGSSQQKDLRELLVKYVETLEKSYFSKEQLTKDDQAFLDEKKSSIATQIKFREMERQFYDELQINEYITRLGQEPKTANASDAWVATVRAMQKFGINNVEAPEGYGTAKYMEPLKTQVFNCKGKCMTFDVNERDVVVRTDRR